MFGFVTRTDPATGARTVNVTRLIDVVRACGLVVVLVTVSLARPRPGTDGVHGVVITVALVLSGLAWVAWMLSDRVQWLSLGSLVSMGAAGGVLAGVSPNSPALAVGTAAVFSAGVRLRTEISLGVLAEILAGFPVSVNLQAAEGLLASDTLPADHPELVKAIECIDRAGTLTREGLAAARRAILALREDAAPLPDQLASLAAQYQAAGDTAINLTVSGEPRPLPGQAAQVAYRTAQEGLTNARKHAPGQPVALSLEFEPGHVRVSVVNPLPPDGSQAPLTATGAGAGLAGLGERAALAGGTLEAGPADGTWRVDLTIPA